MNLGKILEIIKCGVSTLNTDKHEMKTLALIPVVLITMLIGTHAQILNGGFETWENYVDNPVGCKPPYNIYEKPDMWNGSLPKSCETVSYSISKNNESYPAGTGQFSVKIQPDMANGVRGVAISNDGSDTMANWVPKPSFAISQRPASLYLYYKYFPSGGDTMIVKIYFYKNGNIIGNTAWGTTDTISDWTALQIPLEYTTADVPDSATILFVTGAYIQHSESVLYIDNLSFNGFVTSVHEINSEKMIFKLSPNPAFDMVALNVNSKERGVLTMNIYNAIGALVKTEKLSQNQHRINVCDLSEGLYVVEINSNKLSGKQKMLIKR